MRYTYTEELPQSHEDRERRHDWAAEWCDIIAKEVSGLTWFDRQKLFLIILEMEKRVRSGDYTHPARQGPPKPML